MVTIGISVYILITILARLNKASVTEEAKPEAKAAVDTAATTVGTPATETAVGEPPPSRADSAAAPAKRSLSIAVPWRTLRTIAIIAALVGGSWWMWFHTSVGTYLQTQWKATEIDTDTRRNPDVRIDTPPSTDTIATPDDGADTVETPIATPTFDATREWIDSLWTNYIVGTGLEQPLAFMSGLVSELATLTGVPSWVLYTLLAIPLIWFVIRPLWKIIGSVFAGNTWLAPTIATAAVLAFVWFAYSQADRRWQDDRSMAEVRANAEVVSVLGETLADGTHVFPIKWDQVFEFDPPTTGGLTRCFEWSAATSDLARNRDFATPLHRQFYFVPNATASQNILGIVPSQEPVDRYEFTDEFMRELKEVGRPFYFSITINRSC
jgi:hypothetical protein